MKLKMEYVTEAIGRFRHALVSKSCCICFTETCPFLTFFSFNFAKRFLVKRQCEICKTKETNQCNWKTKRYKAKEITSDDEFSFLCQSL